MSENLKLSSPWVTYYNEIKVLFEQDPDINITYDEDSNTVKLFVQGSDKAEAIAKILPTEKEFGNVKLYIEVIPDNSDNEGMDKVLRTALNGNPILSNVIDHALPGTEVPFHYFMFKKEVVQYWNDNLADPNGMTSTLYEDVARDVFNIGDRVYFCTDNE